MKGVLKMAKQYYVEKGFKKALFSDIVTACSEACKAQGARVKDIQQYLEVYVKPEESKAYYVLSAEKCGVETGDITGSVDIAFE